VVNLIFAPSLDRELVQQRVVVTCEGPMATFHTPKDPGSGLPTGIPIDDIPLKHFRLQVWLRTQAAKAIDRLAIRGYDYWDKDDIHVYGPYPSKLLHDRLLTPQDLNLPPEVVSGFVRDRSDDTAAFADYLIVANFVKKPVFMDEEALQHAPLPKELLA
jgi:hypothetical protein